MNARAWTPSLLILILLSGAPSPAQGAAAEDSVAKLMKLGHSCLRYAGHNGGRLPSSLAELYYQGYINSLEDFVCPANPAEIAHRLEIEEKSGYVLSPQAGKDGARPIVQDKTADNNGGKGINVFYSDGSVKWQAASGASASSPFPLLGLSALLFAGGAFFAILALGKKRPASIPQKICAEIEILHADGGRKAYGIREARTTIGRAEDNSLVLHDPDVSLHHAEITVSNGAFFLRDAGSTTGTFLNGERIGVAPLYRDDEIVAGTTRLIVRSSRS